MSLDAVFENALRKLINEHNIDTLLSLSDHAVAREICCFIQRFDGDPDPGEMDGDHTSALASAGWGTDEDYAPGETI